MEKKEKTSSKCNQKNALTVIFVRLLSMIRIELSLRLHVIKQTEIYFYIYIDTE